MDEIKVRLDVETERLIETALYTADAQSGSKVLILPTLKRLEGGTRETDKKGEKPGDEDWKREVKERTRASVLKAARWKMTGVLLAGKAVTAQFADSLRRNPALDEEHKKDLLDALEERRLDMIADGRLEG
ncbi:MAG: hypothetical protein JRL30_01135 [Deltaproteobacteria bacterium]|nr:hypothetical protein [Deltaproteobacteria bacterium]